jgi:DNA-binding MarR family transcriptional regulator
MSVDKHSHASEDLHIALEAASGKTSEIELGMLQMQTLWILSRGPMHGYDLMKALSALKGTEITQGTLYPMLKRLEELGLIRSEDEGRRVVNHITEKGKHVMSIACLDFVKTFYGIFHDYACKRCDIHVKWGKKEGGCHA